MEFYGTTLGLRRSVYLPDRHYAEFETGNVTLSVMDFRCLRHAAPPEPQRDRPARRRCALPRARSLEGRGVSFQGDTFDTGVCHMAFFADPDGNALMLHHRYAPRSTDG